MPRFLAAFCLLMSTVSPSAADCSAQDVGDEHDEQLVQVDSGLNHRLLQQNNNLRKVDLLLDARSAGRITSGRFYLGVSLVTLLDYQRSNVDSKFGYLMRHPTSSNQIGKEVTEAVLHSAQFLVAGSVTDWLTLYSEFLYDPQQSFGTGTITALARNQVQLRKGYVLLGNLNLFPVYGAVGKMDVNFGETGSVSPFTNSTMWHAFGGLGFAAMVGFNSSGINASFTAVQGGAQFRALHAPVESTNVPSRLNNYVVDANYTAMLGRQSRAYVGVSQLGGSAYCQSFPVVHFQPCSKSNSVRTVYGVVHFMDNVVIKASHAKTLDAWPGSHNPNPPLDIFGASRVSSISVGASYSFHRSTSAAYTVSGEFSNFVAGPDGSPWERQNQYVAGAAVTIKRASKLFLEFFRTEGFAPLNFVSGGNLPDLGATHSDADARSFGVVMGALVTL